MNQEPKCPNEITELCKHCANYVLEMGGCYVCQIYHGERYYLSDDKQEFKPIEDLLTIC